MLAAASIGPLSRDGPLADEARIFLKYSANTMTGYFTIRYVDQDLVLGRRPGTMVHSMAADASLMFGLGEREGFKYVTHWLSLSSGYMEVRDGLGMRVGGPVAKSTLPDHLAELLQLKVDSLGASPSPSLPALPQASSHDPLAHVRAVWESSPMKDLTTWDKVEAALSNPAGADLVALSIIGGVTGGRA